MEVKFNVSERLSDSFLAQLANIPVLECLAKLKDCEGVTSPDFERSSSGNYTQPKQKQVSYELFKATKANRVRLEIRQRRGYKCFAFIF